MHYRLIQSVSLSFFVFAVSAFWSGCSWTIVKPIQQRSNTVAAIRAAKEVQADVLAPELYRQSFEWFLQAEKHYQLKYYEEATAALHRSQRYAEEAELQAILSGSKRKDDIPDPLADPMSQMAPQDAGADVSSKTDLYSGPEGQFMETLDPNAQEKQEQKKE